MNERVDIVMATYNGMPYIREQLQSILWQDYPQFRLLIHDDGSTDGTVEEIKKVAERYPDKVFFVEDGITFKDAKKNFEHLLKMTDADYIFLADQDDVWLPSKVSVMVKELYNLEQEYGKNTPLLTFSDYATVDTHGFPIATSMGKIWDVNPRSVCLELLLTKNIVSGCTCCFNRALLEKAIPLPKMAIMHDWWLALIASALGKIKYVPMVLTLYRQHSKNTVGARKTTLASTVSHYLKSPMRAIAAFKRLGKLCINQAYELLLYLEKSGFSRTPQYDIVAQYVEYRTGSYITRVRYFRKFKRDSFLREFWRIIMWNR